VDIGQALQEGSYHFRKFSRVLWRFAVWIGKARLRLPHNNAQNNSLELQDKISKCVGTGKQTLRPGPTGGELPFSKILKSTLALIGKARFDCLTITRRTIHWSYKTRSLNASVRKLALLSSAPSSRATREMDGWANFSIEVCDASRT